MKTERPTVRRVLGMVIGIVIISLGIAIFKQSHLGNDSITALNIRLSELLGISLGVQNICTNLLFLVVEFIWGRKYIGLGTLVNGLGCGFIITFFYDIIAGWFGPAEQLPIQLLWVVIAVPVTAFGCSLYQTADLGVAPYDSLALAPAQALLRLPRLYRCTLCGHHLPAGRPGRHRHPGLCLRPGPFHSILQWRVL